jgi:hypothetical protein
MSQLKFFLQKFELKRFKNHTSILSQSLFQSLLVHRDVGESRKILKPARANIVQIE